MLAFERYPPINPRDFIVQAYPNTMDICNADLAVTDTPVLGESYLYNWCLGDPVLKSACPTPLWTSPSPPG
ncbi:uncharacterized protein BT62DRAFT_1079868 [Guyanagaster necrorhizus]|uniref:Uncharacterized protein n=1 Tax=Guyanagaster necrorhizus TaxID=856835 RepID=A0A9P7VJI0_9AGAR|nr:uncharacterized protein BT62DRAFT_1079868 [Guyanagaster necrorhizus MCA 3950]KAG7441698.1 hypothetical protein BT62DRAFT_1079868 [Guyanagaster necrorhizus MCA 3950]